MHFSSRRSVFLSAWFRVGACSSGLLLSTLPAAAATRWDFQLGRSYMDSHGSAALFVEEVLGDRPIGNSRFTWSSDISGGWIGGRQIKRYRYASYDTQDSIWLIAGGVRISYGSADAWYHKLFFSFQPTLHSGRTQALSSPYEFISTLGWEAHHFSFQVRHISNGGTHEPNRGETMALIGFAFGS